MHGDFPTEVVGIERYHYEPNGEAYNLFFVRPHFALDAMEAVMFNPRDEHQFTSHELDILQYDGEQLDLRRGDRRRTGWPNRIGFLSFSIEAEGEITIRLRPMRAAAAAERREGRVGAGIEVADERRTICASTSYSRQLV